MDLERLISKVGDRFRFRLLANPTPDRHGGAAKGRAVEETDVEIREAIEFHPEGLREDDLALRLSLPQP